jgi:hypothetical protein
VHVHAKLWMVGFCRVPHSNQNTQASIDFYHAILKHWFSFETKGLRGHYINWLVWRLTTNVAWHYMHQAEMKRQGFIKNKIMAWLVVASVDKANRIPHTNVISPTFEGDDGDDFWRVWSQHHPNVTYKIHAPFIEYASCICEWALQGNFASSKLLFYWHLPTLQHIISLSIVTHIMELTMVVWNACLLTRHTYNRMMVCLTMRIATKI